MSARPAALAMLGLAVGLAMAAAALAAEKPEAPEPREAADDAADAGTERDVRVSEDLPIYQPPVRGKPRERVGGAVRGADREWPKLTALVPAHPGLTISARPSFFWYIDELPPPEAMLVFALTREERIDPLIEIELARPTEPGIQRIDLAPLGIALRPGIEYQWSVALVVDEQERAKDIVTFGYVDRVPAPAALATYKHRSPVGLAAHGLWYDALAAVDDWIRDEPDNPSALRAREGLLRQAGLDSAIGVEFN